MKKFTFLMAALVIATMTMAQMSGTFKVGTAEVSPDFTSLSAAITAVNANGVGGDILLLITSDLTEVANIGLGVNTNGFKITIKPQTSVTPTITFTQTVTQSIDGNFVIGSPTVSSTNLVATHNVTIDGSNTTNGTTKDMTFIGSPATIAVPNFRIFGNNDNVTIKNCIITNKSTSASSSAPINATCFMSTTSVAPDNLTVDNNTLTSVSGNGGIGVMLTNSGSPTVGMTGIVISNNIITHRGTRGIMCNYVNDANIFGNQISADIQSAGSACAGIFLTTGFGTAGTFNVYNNKFLNIKTLNNTAGVSNGYICIDNQLGTLKIVNIFNNFITGFNPTAAVTNTKLYGIRQIGASTTNVYHNTIVIPEMTDMTTFGSSFITGIVFGTAASPELAPTGTMNVKNNIIISNETGMKTIGIRRAGTTGTFTSDYNDIYRANTTNGFCGFYNTSDANDLLTWQTASTMDANSKSVAVNFTSATDLSLAGTSIQDANLKVPSLATVLSDIFGTVRNTSFTYAGAHEALLPFIVSSVKDVEQTARIMRTASGIQVEMDGEAAIELYAVNGMMIDKTKVSGTYSHDLNNGVYIIRINGKATKFIK
jgi:hypothetical protein